MRTELPRLRPPCPVILASSSPQRRELLGRILEEFEVHVPGIEEHVDESLEPDELVRELARQKAQAVAGRTAGEAIIIGADTVAWCRGRVIGKPADREDAIRTLLLLSHHPHSVLTGICVLAPPFSREDAVETRIRMHPMTREQAAHYADFGNALDKAGAYALQEQADEFVARLEGSFSNVIGLPLEWLTETLLAIPGTVRIDNDAG